MKKYIFATATNGATNIKKQDDYLTCNIGLYRFGYEYKYQKR